VGGGFCGGRGLRPALQRVKLEHCGCNRRERREAYGSATDGATPAARIKMATAVETRISNVVKVEIGLRRKD